MEQLYNNYKLKDVVGSGSYGNVFRAVHKVTGVEVAVKMIPKNVLTKAEAKMHYDNEASIVEELNHPLVSQVFEVIDGPAATCIVSEYAPNGDLLQFLNETEKTSEEDAQRLFKQILCTVKYIHSMGIAHRDLKPENILLDKNNNIRVIDFGFAKRFGTEGNVFESRCGSPAYVAPEIITGKRYSSAVDIWSMGVILYAFVTETLPFVGDSIEQQLRQVAYSEPEYPTTLSPDLRDLLKGMLQKDPNKRLTISQIEENRWVKSGRGETVITSIRNYNHEIDHTIIDKLRELGVDTFGLEHMIRTNAKSDAVVAYKILNREKICDTMGRAKRTSLGSIKPSVVPLFKGNRTPTRLNQVVKRSENDGFAENTPAKPRVVTPVRSPIVARYRRDENGRTTTARTVISPKIHRL